MSRNGTDWKKVTKDAPCPICGKSDRCKVCIDGNLAFCWRPCGPPNGWEHVKNGKSSGAVYSRIGISQGNAVVQDVRHRDWASEAAKCTVQITKAQKSALAQSLGVSIESLEDIGVGTANRNQLKEWCAGFEKREGCKDRPSTAYTIPEYDGNGMVIGLSLRAPDGRKGSPKGTNRGVIVPKSFVSSADPMLCVEGASDVAAGLTMCVAIIGRSHNSGGAEILAVRVRESMNLIVVGENDAKADGRWPGRDGAQRVAQRLANILQRPVIWSLPPAEYKDIRGWLNKKVADPSDVDACTRARNELLEVLLSNATNVSPCDSVLERTRPVYDNRPEVFIEVDEFRSSDAAIAALSKDLDIFQRDGALVRLVQRCSDHAPCIEAIPPANLRDRLTRRCRFMKCDSDGEPIQTHPPGWLVSAIQARGFYAGFRSLSGIITCPTFAPDGTLIVASGYHEVAGGVWHHPSLKELPTVPEVPTTDEITSARSLLLDLIADFPFVDAASRANAIALMLLPFVRLMIEGPTPLHLFDAPTPGSGKTLLANVCTFPSLGSELYIGTGPDDADEWRKRITALLQEGRPIIVFDNAKHRLDSQHLAAVLTTTHWTDRVLGATRVTSLPNRAVWIGTGNNIDLSKEMARRSTWIRIDTRQESPELRTSFRHPRLMEYVRSNRTAIVGAALTLIRAWCSAGRPSGDAVMGMYEDYAETISGVFHVAGIDGFIANAGGLRKQSDGESQEWRPFISTWWHRFRSEWVGVRDLAGLLWDEDGNRNDLLGSAVDGKSSRGDSTRLGKLLSKKRDSVIASFIIRVDAAHGDHKRLAYRLEPASEETLSLHDAEVSPEVSVPNKLKNNELEHSGDMGDLDAPPQESTRDYHAPMLSAGPILRVGKEVSNVSQQTQVGESQRVMSGDLHGDFVETSVDVSEQTECLRVCPSDHRATAVQHTEEREVFEL